MWNQRSQQGVSKLCPLRMIITALLQKRHKYSISRVFIFFTGKVDHIAAPSRISTAKHNHNETKK